MTTTLKNLGSFNTNHITLDDALMTITIPFTVESEQVKKIIEERYNTFRDTYPEAANPYHETYIFFHLGQQMQVNYDFVVSICDDEQNQLEYYDIDYSLSSKTKEQIKSVVWKKMSELLFTH